jgi:hypothetical protein
MNVADANVEQNIDYSLPLNLKWKGLMTMNNRAPNYLGFNESIFVEKIG